MRVQYVLSEIGAGLRRNLTMTIAVIITVAISTALLGTGLLFRAQAETTKGYWYDKVEISVYMCNGYLGGGQCAGEAVTDTERATIKQTLESNSEVDEVFHESHEQAYEFFREQFDDTISDAITPDQLQEAFRVALVDPEEYDGEVSAVDGLPGVQKVVDKREVLGELFGVLNGFTRAAIMVAILELIATTLLIANTVRLGAFNRHRETDSVRPVGA